jgi:chaperonin cofactor prefoldin
MMNEDAPKFETWEPQTLIAFAQASYTTLKRQTEEIEQLRADLKDTRKAYRELIILHEDDGK